MPRSSEKPSSARRTWSYTEALKRVSTRTGAPLPSLITSFAILHEATAVVPFVGFFYLSRNLGAGNTAVSYIREKVAASGNSGMLLKIGEWMDQGEQWGARVGTRYGLWGFEKGIQKDTETRRSLVAGDLANAMLAYTLTKALLPVRIGLSLYLSPALSRRFIEPVRLRIYNAFQGLRKPKW